MSDSETTDEWQDDPLCCTVDCLGPAEVCASCHEKLKRRIALLEETLRFVQWGSCDGCGAHGFCPQCGCASQPYDDEGNEMPGKHAPDCFVGQALDNCVGQ